MKNVNIIKYLTSHDIFQYKVISTEQITFSEDVVNACKANHCGKYGSCWTCPPGIGQPDNLSHKLKKYKNAIVFTYKGLLEDSFDIDSMDAAAEQSSKILREICDMLSKDKINYFPLGCGSCKICSSCTYPDLPCRFPEKAISSVEAYGIDVVKLASDININYHNGVNTVTYFNLIFY